MEYGLCPVYIQRYSKTESIKKGEKEMNPDTVKLIRQRKIGDRAGEGNTLNNLATAALARGDYDTALDYLKQSLALQRRSATVSVKVPT